MKFSLSGLFNRNKPLAVPLQDLAAAVKPFTQDTGCKPPEVAQAWREAAMWIQAAFSQQNHKGDLYYSLHLALHRIAADIGKAGEGAQSVLLDRPCLSLLKGSHHQFQAAAEIFEATSRIQKSGASISVAFKTGEMAMISPIPFAQMPGADHGVLARQMKMIERTMTRFCDGLDVKMPTHAQLAGNEPPHQRDF